ncbi:TetR/AcrR family transcriptional regulator [Kibdelosporangium persicum]|uniref:DNA-binding transcriptional regulator, AcrR family n=1 Tax=Kibdelosporangium persicum TaxID=2698649 RepID=A0ABX2F2N8_9PSEU|nr:TetR/AcrR family transcriptional regulator [Kibdelosporangium persicum]NRN65575.1 DNA-binding transcriptional regulator, AcrR family [Kibdelosporangium persicum]
MPPVIHPSRSTRKERREAMERRMLTAAEQLIRDGENFGELSVERLAGAAGISRSTFYVHFEDKGDLARRMVKTVVAELEDVSRGWLTSADRADRDQLRAAVDAIIGVYREHGAAFTMVSQAADFDTTVAQELRGLMQRLITATREAIELGQAAGVMRPVAPKETAAVIIWMIERVGHQMLRPADASGHEKVAEVLTDVIWSTLYRG